MSYHDKIMNLQLPPARLDKPCTREERIHYKEGHRDARHAAAELAIQADETIRCQQQVLDQIAQALGLEPDDVDGIGAAIGALIVDRDAAVMQLRDERNAAVEIEGLKRDAARYRWIRSRDLGEYRAFQMLCDDEGYFHCEQDLDQAIDKALAAGEAGNG